MQFKDIAHYEFYNHFFNDALFIILYGCTRVKTSEEVIEQRKQATIIKNVQQDDVNRFDEPYLRRFDNLQWGSPDQANR